MSQISTAKILFENRVERTESCWLWRGCTQANGYGFLKVGGRAGKRIYAHRLAYELFKSSIPDGLEIDHLCRVRHCVNPDHLEPVTRSQNVRRGIGPAMLGNLNGSKTHCKRGHLFDARNTRWRPTGGRDCRACQRIHKSNLRNVAD